MANGSYLGSVPQQYFDLDGNPLSSGTLETFIAGTTTHLATYSDIGLTVPNANPMTLDSAGYPSSGAVIGIPGASYKLVWKDSLGATIDTVDNYVTPPSSSSNQEISGVAGETLTAGSFVYLSDGSGGKVAGSWYNTNASNAYGSTNPDVGMVPVTIASGSTGTIRLGGQATSLTSLTIGSDYYLSASVAGGLSLTAPQNARRVGRADSTTTLVLDPNPPPFVNVNLCQGRRTLTTGTPVTIADVTAATSLFFTPYAGNWIALYDGTRWGIHVFSQVTIAVPATTSQMYDVFLYDNAGTLTLELQTWTNDTTRTTALTTQDGVLVKTGALTRRYLGSFRTTGVSGQTEDSYAKRYLWNYYNRMRRSLRVLEPANTWAYTIATYRQANANTANQLDCVVGVAEVQMWAQVIGNASTTTGAIVSVSIGEDSTSTPKVGVLTGALYPASGGFSGLQAVLETYPAVGRHFYAWLEQSEASGTTTWVGDNGGTTYQSGIHGWIDG